MPLASWLDALQQAVEEYSSDQRASLLQFVTSCPRPPLLGFRDLYPRFCIAAADSSRMPTAATCVNLLRLPRCGSAEELRRKLDFAVSSATGFDLS